MSNLLFYGNEAVSLRQLFRAEKACESFSTINGRSELPTFLFQSMLPRHWCLCNVSVHNAHRTLKEGLLCWHTLAFNLCSSVCWKLLVFSCVLTCTVQSWTMQLWKLQPWKRFWQATDLKKNRIQSKYWSKCRFWRIYCMMPSARRFFNISSEIPLEKYT